MRVDLILDCFWCPEQHVHKVDKGTVLYPISTQAHAVRAWSSGDLRTYDSVYHWRTLSSLCS